ncbi:hypothetical protein LR48_Vigan02g134200 [Vigna angularis]|uniref:Uncharacterized protein n=1 Tax=Phaseolus angularis TaxID=3914 RepID=A0A0L9TXR4_PHAAN|nr:hypothetical protein LR48_Vigan02g134200 [Vigna angularis]
MVTPLSISFSPPPMIHRATTTDHLPELHLAMIGHIHLSWSPKLIIGSDTKCREISFYFASHSHSSLPFVSSLSLAFLGTPHSHFSVFKIRAGRGHYCGWFSLALKQYEGIVVVVVGLRFWHPCVGQNLSTGSISVIIAIPIFLCEVRFGVLQTFEAFSFEGNIDLCGEQLNKSCPGDYSTAKAEAGTEKDGDDSDLYEALYISMGCRLWHRASTTDYPEQPTFIVLRPDRDDSDGVVAGRFWNSNDGGGGGGDGSGGDCNDNGSDGCRRPWS